MELNPNHRATQAAHDHWHKIAALLMFKMGKKNVTITTQEINSAFNEQLNISVQFDDEVGILLRLVDDKEAMELARREGGLLV